MAHHKVIAEPARGRSYENKKGGGNLVVWNLELEGLGPVELHKKEGNDPPPIGGVVNVEDSWDGEFGGEPFKRIKLAYEAGGNSTGGDSKNFDRRPEHPENAARMRHTSALSAAPVYIEQMLTIGVIEQPKDQAAYKVLVANVVTWIEQSYPSVAVPAPPASDVPADTQGLEPQPQTADESIPF